MLKNPQFFFIFIGVCPHNFEKVFFLEGTARGICVGFKDIFSVSFIKGAWNCQTQKSSQLEHPNNSY